MELKAGVGRANAFEVLGLTMDADQAQVHAAYRSRVKHCHPDQFQEKEQQEQAQEQLIRLNLAYEEAMRMTARRQIGMNSVSCEEAKRLAKRLYDQGRCENALRQLLRAENRDADWYYLQGSILMKLQQYASAHQSYREAVRQEPDNLSYRRGAFEAAKAVQKHARPVQRAVDAVGKLFRPRGK
jgi:tetratricopeptide (TPR) repeat protein